VVAKQDVAYAFRLILGREAESEAVLEHFAANVPDLAALRSAFIGCAEFQAGRARIQPERYRHPAVAPNIETTATAPDLARLVAGIEKNWASLGSREPHWSVLTDARFTAARIAENDAAFFDSGRAGAAEFQAACTRNGIALPGAGTCFELGCGVGRVSIWLADLFGQVVAADISTTHLAIARATAERFARPNIRFLHLNRLDDIGRIESFDAFYSVIVLQHNPPPVMRELLRGLLGRLNPRGVAYFQIPTAIAGYSFRSASHEPTADDMDMHCFPQARLFQLIAEQGCDLIECLEEEQSTPVMASNAVLVRKR